MNENKNLDDDKIGHFRNLFVKTLEVANKLREKVDSKKVDSKNVAEAVMIGIASNIETLENKDPETLDQMYRSLLDHPRFAAEEMKEGLSSEEKVNGRIDSAIEAFSRG